MGISLPFPGELIDAEVVVAPLRGTPEYHAYSWSLSQYRGGVIRERDPHRALMLALSYPKAYFERVIIGVDPGRECGLAGIADSLLVHARRVPCERLGEIVEELRYTIPWKRWEVYVGNGHGFAYAAASLSAHGIDYGVVEEASTSRPEAKPRMALGIRDRDIIAGVAIALRGAYSGGRLPFTVRR